MILKLTLKFRHEGVQECAGMLISFFFFLIILLIRLKSNVEINLSLEDVHVGSEVIFLKYFFLIWF